MINSLATLIRRSYPRNTYKSWTFCHVFAHPHPEVRADKGTSAIATNCWTSDQMAEAGKRVWFWSKYCLKDCRGFLSKIRWNEENQYIAEIRCVPTKKCDGRFVEDNLTDGITSHPRSDGRLHTLSRLQSYALDMKCDGNSRGFAAKSHLRKGTKLNVVISPHLNFSLVFPI